MSAFRRNIKALCASVIALVRLTKKISTGVFLFCFSALCYGQSDVDWSKYVFADPVVGAWTYGAGGRLFDSEGEAVAVLRFGSCDGKFQIVPSGGWRPSHVNKPLGGYNIAEVKDYTVTVKKVNNQLKCELTESFITMVGRGRPVDCPIQNGTQFLPTPDRSRCYGPVTLNCDGGSVGNPCSPITGDKYAIGQDIIAENVPQFTRYYHSAALKLNSPLGLGWRHNYQTRWVPRSGPAGGYIENAQGYQIPMVWSEALKVFKPLGKMGYSLARVDNEWVLTYASSRRDIFNEAGQLIRQEDNSNITRLAYDAEDRLVSVTNQFGHRLTLDYNNNNLVNQITDASGAVYRYVYDGKRNLTAVVYPDRTAGNTTDNPRRRYHYENEKYPNHLTGITDENNQRFATYAYDSQGRAILTQHAKTTNSVGQETFELEYQ